MKKLLAMLLATTMAWSLVSCGSTTTTAPAETSTPAASTDTAADSSDDADAGEAVTGDLNGEGYTINFIFKHLANVYWELASAGANQAAADYGFNVNILAPINNGNNDEQIALIEQSLAQGVDAIVLAPNDSEAILPAAKQILENGTTLLTFSTAPADGTYDGYVGIENYDIGYGVVQDLCALGNNEGTAVIIEGPLGQQNSIDRALGAQDAFDENGVEVVSRQSANWARTEALTLVQNILQENPDIKYIFCANDEMALGASEACSQAGKSDILISGVDASPEAVIAISEGRLTASVYQDPYGQAYKCAELAIAHLMGQTIESEFIMTGIVVTSENVAEYLE